MILGVPPGGWVGGVGGWGWGVVRGCTPPTCTCMHVHTRVYEQHREFPGIPPVGAAICMKLPCLPCMHVHVCMHVCMCLCVGGTLNQPPPPNTHPPPPPPRAAGSRKHQNSITLELIEIIRFCLKILYL